MAKLSLGGSSPEYGDKTVLDQFRSATKPLPISGAPAPKRGPGRPAGQTAQQAPAPAPSGGAVPPEHLEAMQRLSRAEQVAEFWQNLAASAPSPVTQMYAKRAASVRDRLALTIYKNTPNFF